MTATLPQGLVIHPGLASESRRDAWLAVRARNVSSSEVAALFGLSPYLTPLELWGIKKGVLADGFRENVRMEAGRHLEPAIAAWAGSRLGIEVRPFKDYYELPSARTGASFDWEALEGPKGCEGPGVVEVKNVDWRVFHSSDRTWNGDDPEDLIAPTHVELQIQHQLMLTGRQWALLAVCVGGNDLRLAVRQRREPIIVKLQSRIARFWESIDQDAAPPADYERDGPTLRGLYAPRSTPAMLDQDAHARLARATGVALEAGDRKRQAEAEESHAKAEIIDILRGADCAALDDGTRLTWRADKRGVRTLRITQPAAQEAA